jgi:hypothetical protein
MELIKKTPTFAQLAWTEFKTQFQMLKITSTKDRVCVYLEIIGS